MGINDPGSGEERIGGPRLPGRNWHLSLRKGIERYLSLAELLLSTQSTSTPK